MADIDNVNSANNNNNPINDRSVQSDPANLIRSVTDAKTGAVDTRQLASDVAGAKDFHAASQAYEQIEAELSRQDPKLAAQFSRDVADAFATRNSAAGSGQGTASGASASDVSNQSTPPGLTQLLESKGIQVPTPASTVEGTTSYRPPRIENLPPTSIKFSQKDVAPRTGDGIPLKDVEQSMKTDGWKGGPIDAVESADGSLTSVDNRRLLSAQNAGLKEIPVRVHDANEPISGEDAGRFTLKSNIRQLEDGQLVVGGTRGQILYPKGSIPQTWGEATLFRTADQGNVRGAGRFPLGGTYDKPAVRPDRGAQSTPAVGEQTPNTPPVNQEPPATTRIPSVEEGAPGAKPGTPSSNQGSPSALLTTSTEEGTSNPKTTPSFDPESGSFTVKQGTIAGVAIGTTVTAAQLALAGKLNVQNLKEVGKGSVEGGVIGAVATKAEQLLTPVIDRTVGTAVQKGVTQIATTLGGEGAADTAGVVARTMATKVAGGTIVGAAISAGISAWDNRVGLAHGDSKAIGNVVADTTVAVGSIAAATAAGAAIGSVVPVAGTAVGAVVGLAVGVGITYGAQISGVRDAIANGVAHGVDGIKDAAKSVGSTISNAASGVAHFFGF